jgi:hypothetical protein
VGVSGKKPSISETPSPTRGPVATGSSAGEEGAESDEERKELVLED